MRIRIFRIFARIILWRTRRMASAHSCIFPAWVKSISSIRIWRWFSRARRRRTRNYSVHWLMAKSSSTINMANLSICTRRLMCIILAGPTCAVMDSCLETRRINRRNFGYRFWKIALKCCTPSQSSPRVRRRRCDSNRNSFNRQMRRTVYLLHAISFCKRSAMDYSNIIRMELSLRRRFWESARTKSARPVLCIKQHGNIPSNGNRQNSTRLISWWPRRRVARAQTRWRQCSKTEPIHHPPFSWMNIKPSCCAAVSARINTDIWTLAMMSLRTICRITRNWIMKKPMSPCSFIRRIRMTSTLAFAISCCAEMIPAHRTCLPRKTRHLKTIRLWNSAMILVASAVGDGFRCASAMTRRVNCAKEARILAMHIMSPTATGILFITRLLRTWFAPVQIYRMSSVMTMSIIIV